MFGTGGSGKTTFLRTLAVAASAAAGDTWIYAIDSAGGALTGLSALPNVGAVIPLTDTERITRLLSRLRDWGAERSRMLASSNASTLTEYNRTAPRPLPRILVLIDGMSAFRAEYEFRDAGKLFDSLTQLIGLGRQLGIHFALTADRQAAIPQSLLASLQERVVLRLASDAEYDILGVPRDGLLDAPAGRGFVRGREVQIGTPAGSGDLTDQAEALDRLAASIRYAAEPVRRLEEHIDWSDLPADIDGRPTLGVADDTLTPVGIPEGLFVVTGPFQSGRTTTMRTALHAVLTRNSDAEVFLLAGRPGHLRSCATWTAAAEDVDDADALAHRLLADLASGAVSALVIVVESSGDFEGTPTESTIARLLKAARRVPGARILVETDTVTAGSAWQIFTELKTARGGIVLQPEESDGAGIFRVQFPRATRSDFPPGRGFLVEAGRVRRVQVALPPAEDTVNIHHKPAEPLSAR